MLVVLVVRERRASACLIMLSAKQGSHWYYFNAFGMARPGIEPTTSRSRSGRSTICAIGTGNRIFHGTIRHIYSGFPSYARTLCALTLLGYALKVTNAFINVLLQFIIRVFDYSYVTE